MRYSFLPAAVLIFLGLFTARAQDPVYIEEYGDLFDSVQSREIFSDQKKFVDCVPQYPPGEILEKYLEQRENPAFDLGDFVAANFDTSFVDTNDVLKHIDLLWDYLSRDPDDDEERSTLIPLKHPYIVPGGRFREIYYWDSYFTMLGLAEAGKYEMIGDMLDNISDLINNYGHMPNGNRTYYLSRSQPPFFSLMVDLYARCRGDYSVYKSYHQALKKEYDFWNRGKESLSEEYTGKYRVVLLEDHDYLNRYWDDLETPRPESYLHDVRIEREAGGDPGIYRDLRAAAESGWDFSSRWFADGKDLTTIHTTDFVPVDLNCLLYNLEITLSRGFREDSLSYMEAAEKRKRLILDYCWNEEAGFFFDYDCKTRAPGTVYTLAALYPLFFGIADANEAGKVLQVIKNKFLKDGGVVTTLNNTGQQWDYPNGWPPLQWVAYKSCMNYGMDELAGEIAARWINLNVRVFFSTQKMMEKYDVVNTGRPGGGGEYKTQDGFGWTNGVFLKLWNETKER